MSKHDPEHSYDETISQKGFRFTGQRRAVYDALMAQRDHPTATDVFLRVKQEMPTISLATVYNCLETLTECGLVRHVNIERQPSRYCANTQEHGHFFCDSCGTVIDVPKREAAQLGDAWQLPKQCVVRHHEAAFRGLCPDCAKQESSSQKSLNRKTKV
jgi:Fur family peroxide stress response transcriptional regulator